MVKALGRFVELDSPSSAVIKYWAVEFKRRRKSCQEEHCTRYNEANPQNGIELKVRELEYMVGNSK